jgi:hypothetical protein
MVNLQYMWMNILSIFIKIYNSRGGYFKIMWKGLLV